MPIDAHDLRVVPVAAGELGKIAVESPAAQRSGAPRGQGATGHPFGPGRMAPPLPPVDVDAEALTLDERRREQALRIVRGALPRYRRGYFRALRGEVSVRRAVRIMCLHCVGWETTGARECTAYGCPLWAFNPWRRSRIKQVKEQP